MDNLKDSDYCFKEVKRSRCSRVYAITFLVSSTKPCLQAALQEESVGRRFYSPSKLQTIINPEKLAKESSIPRPSGHTAIDVGLKIYIYYISNRNFDVTQLSIIHLKKRTPIVWLIFAVKFKENKKVFTIPKKLKKAVCGGFQTI